MGLYRCPYPPFPFPTYHPGMGTGSGYRNRKPVGPCLQPSFKRGSKCLTLLHIGNTDAHLHQSQYEQDDYQDQYRHHQQVPEREPRAPIPTHTFSFRPLCNIPLDSRGLNADTKSRQSALQA
jgi:hypothetical protein